jgi:hypothetical protein
MVSCQNSLSTEARPFPREVASGCSWWAQNIAVTILRYVTASLIFLNTWRATTTTGSPIYHT